MIIRKLFFALLSIVLTAQIASAQFFPAKNYPQNYFKWPVKADIAIVANFGELRANHYHMGLDCRTNHRVNMPVVAAADGYIAKVKIEPFGFGRCIYINHPNGLTTVYAHLNDFNATLEKYITDQQYKLKKWAVFLDIPAGMFPVKQGDFIAYSGTTGGSQGPHTHFEIRDTKTDKVLNELLFNLPIKDNIPPDVLRLAVYDRSKSTYEQTPKIYSLKKVNGVYTVAGGKIYVNFESVSFAITAFDKYTGSTNHNGIYQAVVYDNDKAVCGFQLDSISYDETRYVNANIDYKTRENGGPYLQHLSRLPGYNNSVYKSDGSDGVIRLDDENAHDIKIVVADANGNSSTVKFVLVSQGNSVKTKMPDDINKKEFYPGFINVFENNNLSFYLPENCLYDSFTFVYKEIQPNAGNTIYQLHNPTVPLQTYFPIKIRADFPIDDTGKIVMKRWYGNKEDYVKANAITFGNQTGWYQASFREFGNFQLMVDKEPPVVTPIGFSNGITATKLKHILFSVKDNTEEIKSFTALLDGNWLRFTNDKGKNFIYNFDKYCPPGSHELKIIVEDQVGNIAEKKYNFTR
jgi:Icc-related predicted phosphoesterase